MSPTQALAPRIARAALALTWPSLTAARQARVLRSAADFLACAEAGGRRPEMAPARLLTGGGSFAALRATEHRDGPAAALLLGTAVALLQLHDAYPEGGNHPGSAVISAVLALRPVSALDRDAALGAVAAGYEVANRLARAGQPGQQRAGFTPTSVGGAVGAAVAAGLMLGLDEGRLAEAVGLATLGAAATPFASLRAHGDATPLHGGLAARAGVEAALMAHGGLSAGARVLEGDADTPGWLAMMRIDGAALAPETWDGACLDGVVWKLFPACFSCHLPLETALRAPPVDPGNIAAIEIGLPMAGMTLVAEGPRLDRGLYDRLMSVRWTVALALIHRAYGLEAADAETSGVVLALMERTYVRHAPELDALAPGRAGGRVRLSLRDGTVHVMRHERALLAPPEDGGPAGWSADPADRALDDKIAALSDPTVGGVGGDPLAAFDRPWPIRPAAWS